MSERAVATLLRGADTFLDMAREAQADDQPLQALALALIAGQYVRAASAMQDMNDAARSYEESRLR